MFFVLEVYMFHSDAGVGGAWRRRQLPIWREHEPPSSADLHLTVLFTSRGKKRTRWTEVLAPGKEKDTTVSQFVSSLLPSTPHNKQAPSCPSVSWVWWVNGPKGLPWRNEVTVRSTRWTGSWGLLIPLESPVWICSKGPLNTPTFVN